MYVIKSDNYDSKKLNLYLKYINENKDENTGNRIDDKVHNSEPAKDIYNPNFKSSLAVSLLPEKQCITAP